MDYKIIVSMRTQQEIEAAIDFYSLYSDNAPKHFISSLSSCYSTLSFNPFFRVVYKNIRALKLKHFPYSLYFTVNEEEKIVMVLSCFHNKRNPKNRP
jgi:toxin ParE1/3/4